MPIGSHSSENNMGKNDHPTNSHNMVRSQTEQDSNASLRKSVTEFFGRAKDKLRSPAGHRRNRSTEIAGLDDTMNDSKTGVTLTKFEVMGSVRSPSASPNASLNRLKVSRKAASKTKTLFSSSASNPGPVNDSLLHPHWSEKPGASTLPVPDKKQKKQERVEKHRKHSAPPEVMRRDVEGAIEQHLAENGSKNGNKDGQKDDPKRGQDPKKGQESEGGAQRDPSPLSHTDMATLLLNHRNLLMNSRREERIPSTAPDCCSIETASDSGKDIVLIMK